MENGKLVPDLTQKLEVKSGELKSYLDLRDGIGGNSDVKGIPYYVEMLNNFARALLQEVNRVHQQGYNDHVKGSWSGIDFFWAKDENGDYYDNTTLNLNTTHLSYVNAGNICLSKAIEEDIYNIACSSVMINKTGAPEELQRGNNENMNALYALFLKKDIALGSLTAGGISIGSLDGYTTSIRFDVGNTLSTAIKTADNGFTLTVAAENQRLAVAGVSIDEEMTNLVKYQHAYNGAARVITAMDELLDKLINGTGRVGL
jgi:flagellar hook-associated protein 1 FlgK